MGIFDKGKKKRGDEFDSPVEKIDLTSPSSGAIARESDDEDEEIQYLPASASQAVSASPTASSASALADERRPAARADAAERRPAPRRASGYGIDDAIALMRTLPSDNVELVVQVVKHTLESTKIEIGTIIEDASDKQARIEARVKVLKSEISDLENEIATRRREIEGLETDHRETTMVKDRLQLAERLTARPGEAQAAPARASRTTGGDLGRPRTNTQPPTTPLGVSTQPPTTPLAMSPPPTSGPGAISAGVPSSTPAPAAPRPMSSTVVVKK